MLDKNMKIIDDLLFYKRLIDKKEWRVLDHWYKSQNKYWKTNPDYIIWRLSQ
tara:strand:+ start:1209 stop:1364 length:156 start_codon:yes stop_codon:yes gene_type:complete